ncbi:hypothetical protein PAPHI01_1123 [Pancytospora philotis]|nr:hypothetical protein PAPHI01_1123 [Pancytospora philotis]
MVLAALYVLLGHCHPAGDAGVARVRLYEARDYEKFGALTSFGFSDLEKRVLDPLYRYCAKLSSPETPQRITNARMPEIPAEDKVRDIIFSVLSDGSTPSLHDRLLSKFGYGSHLLLKKVFHDPYVQHLKSRSDAVPKTQTHEPGTYDYYQHQAFSELVKESSTKLGAIFIALSNRAISERDMELREYAEQHDEASDSIDYALLTLGKYHQKNNGLPSEYSSLLDFWFDDDDRFTQKSAEITSYFQILTQRYMTNLKVPIDFKKPFFARVFCKDTPGSFKLLRSLYSETYTKSVVAIRLPDYCFSTGLRFFCDYIEFVDAQKYASKSTARFILAHAWSLFLKSAKALEYEEPAPKKRPDLYKSLPFWFTREVCERLRLLPDDDPARDVNMRKLMRLLDFDVLIHILRRYSEAAEQNELLDLMIRNLDESCVVEYLCMAYSEEYLDSKLRGVVPLVRKVIAALDALSTKRRAKANAAGAQ